MPDYYLTLNFLPKFWYRALSGFNFLFSPNTAKDHQYQQDDQVMVSNIASTVFTLLAGVLLGGVASWYISHRFFLKQENLREMESNGELGSVDWDIDSLWTMISDRRHLCVPYGWDRLNMENQSAERRDVVEGETFRCNSGCCQIFVQRVDHEKKVLVFGRTPLEKSYYIQLYPDNDKTIIFVSREYDCDLNRWGFIESFSHRAGPYNTRSITKLTLERFYNRVLDLKRGNDHWG